MSKTLKLPVEIGTVVYDADFPQYPQRVIGYRIGRMTGEDEEEFEEEREIDELYMEYEGGGISCSSCVSCFGKSIFLTREEAIHGGKKKSEVYQNTIDQTNGK